MNAQEAQILQELLKAINKLSDATDRANEPKEESANDKFRRGREETEAEQRERDMQRESDDNFRKFQDMFEQNNKRNDDMFAKFMKANDDRFDDFVSSTMTDQQAKAYNDSKRKRPRPQFGRDSVNDFDVDKIVGGGEYSTLSAMVTSDAIARGDAMSKNQFKSMNGINKQRQTELKRAVHDGGGHITSQQAINFADAICIKIFDGFLQKAISNGSYRLPTDDDEFKQADAIVWQAYEAAYAYLKQILVSAKSSDEMKKKGLRGKQTVRATRWQKKGEKVKKMLQNYRDGFIRKHQLAYDEFSEMGFGDKNDGADISKMRPTRESSPTMKHVKSFVKDVGKGMSSKVGGVFKGMQPPIIVAMPTAEEPVSPNVPKATSVSAEYKADEAKEELAIVQAKEEAIQEEQNDLTKQSNEHLNKIVTFFSEGVFASNMGAHAKGIHNKGMDLLGTGIDIASAIPWKKIAPMLGSVIGAAAPIVIPLVLAAGIGKVVGDYFEDKAKWIEKGGSNYTTYDTNNDDYREKLVKGVRNTAGNKLIKDGWGTGENVVWENAQRSSVGTLNAILHEADDSNSNASLPTAEKIRLQELIDIKKGWNLGGKNKDAAITKLNAYRKKYKTKVMGQHEMNHANSIKFDKEEMGISSTMLSSELGGFGVRSVQSSDDYKTINSELTKLGIFDQNDEHVQYYNQRDTTKGAGHQSRQANTVHGKIVESNLVHKSSVGWAHSIEQFTPQAMERMKSDPSFVSDTVLLLMRKSEMINDKMANQVLEVLRHREATSKQGSQQSRTSTDTSAALIAGADIDVQQLQANTAASAKQMKELLGQSNNTSTTNSSQNGATVINNKTINNNGDIVRQGLDKVNVKSDYKTKKGGR